MTDSILFKAPELQQELRDWLVAHQHAFTTERDGTVTVVSLEDVAGEVVELILEREVSGWAMYSVRADLVDRWRDHIASTGFAFVEVVIDRNTHFFVSSVYQADSDFLRGA